MKAKEKVAANGMLEQFEEGGWVVTRAATNAEVFEHKYDTCGKIEGDIVCLIKIDINDDIEEYHRVFVMTEEAFERMQNSEILKEQVKRYVEGHKKDNNN